MRDRFWAACMAGGLLARLGVAFGGDFVLHPDDTFQILEPAAAWVHGRGFLAWEFVFGARSPLAPLLVAGGLFAAALAGLPRLGGRGGGVVPRVDGDSGRDARLCVAGGGRFPNGGAGRAAVRVFLVRAGGPGRASDGRDAGGMGLLGSAGAVGAGRGPRVAARFMGSDDAAGFAGGLMCCRVRGAAHATATGGGGRGGCVVDSPGDAAGCGHAGPVRRVPGRGVRRCRRCFLGLSRAAVSFLAPERGGERAVSVGPAGCRGVEPAGDVRDVAAVCFGGGLVLALVPALGNLSHRAGVCVCVALAAVWLPHAFLAHREYRFVLAMVPLWGAALGLAQAGVAPGWRWPLRGVLGVWALVASVCGLAGGRCRGRPGRMRFFRRRWMARRASPGSWGRRTRTARRSGCCRRRETVCKACGSFTGGGRVCRVTTAWPLGADV